MKRSKVWVVPGAGVVALALVLSACGARLSRQQIEAATRSGGGAAAAGGTATASGGATDAAGGAAAAGTAAQTGGAAATGAAAAGGAGSAAVGATAAQAAAAKAPPGGNGGSTDVGVTATDITLGNVSTLTGPVPGLFRGAAVGAQAFLAYQNSLGGVFGRRLKLVVDDDNLDPGTNKAKVDDLIPKVFAFVGSFSVVDDGGAPDLGQSGVPDVGYSLSRARFGLANNYSPQPLPSGWRLGPLQHFKQVFGNDVIQHIAYYTLDAQAAKDAAAGEQAAAKSVGYAFCSCSRTIEPNEQNFTADVVQMQQNGVKGVMMSGDVGTMARMASAMKANGFSVPFANWGANAYDPAFISQAKDAAEGATLDQQLSLYAGEDAAILPEVALFDQWMHQVSPSQKPDIFAAFSWASARLFVQALQAAGAKATRAGLTAALKAINTFDDNGMLAPAGPAAKRPSSCYLIIKVQGGKFVRSDDPANGYRCADGDYFYLK